MSLVRLRYVTGTGKVKMIPRSKFIEDYYEEKCKKKAHWILFHKIMKFNNEKVLKLVSAYI